MMISGQLAFLHAEAFFRVSIPRDPGHSCKGSSNRQQKSSNIISAAAHCPQVSHRAVATQEETSLGLEHVRFIWRPSLGTNCHKSNLKVKPGKTNETQIP